MGIFKTEGIVLQVGKYSEKELYYKVLFREYGLLTVKKRKKAREKPIDSGYFIACEVVTKNSESIHTLGNIKIHSFFDASSARYAQIESFMLIISYLQKNLAPGSPNYELFHCISKFIKISNTCSIQKFLLTRLKIISLLGNLGDQHSDPTCQKILKFIHASKYSDIMRLGKIPDSCVKNLEQML